MSVCLLLFGNAGCTSTGDRIKEETAALVPSAPRVEDPHEGKERKLENIERDLANAKAAVASLEAERESAYAAAQRAREEAIRAWSYAIAGLGVLAMIIGGVVLFFGSRKIAMTLLIGGGATAGMSFFAAWAIPWMIKLAPVLGIGLLIAVGYVIWKKQFAGEEAVRAVEKMKDLAPEAWEEIREEIGLDQAGKKIDKEIKRLKERVNKENTKRQ